MGNQPSIPMHEAHAERDRLNREIDHREKIIGQKDKEIADLKWEMENRVKCEREYWERVLNENRDKVQCKIDDMYIRHEDSKRNKDKEIDNEREKHKKTEQVQNENHQREMRLEKEQSEERLEMEKRKHKKEIKLEEEKHQEQIKLEKEKHMNEMRIKEKETVVIQERVKQQAIQKVQKCVSDNIKEVQESIMELRRMQQKTEENYKIEIKNMIQKELKRLDGLMEERTMIEEN